jgi:hypothetical protein
MQPEHSLPKLAPEQAPVNSGEHIEHGLVRPTPEITIETGSAGSAERHEQVAESSAAASDAAGAAIPVITLPAVDGTQVPSSTTIVSDDSPIIANDDDLIEKEWVDKAKKIINDTKNDPHLREEEVGKLQKAYLKKRYGKELGETE